MAKIHDMDEYLNKMSEEAIKNDRMPAPECNHFWNVGTIHLEFPSFDERQIIEALHNAGYSTCLMGDDVLGILRTNDDMMIRAAELAPPDVDDEDLEW